MRACCRTRITATCLCSGLFLFPVPGAQKPSSTQPSVVLRSTTRLVQLTVVVHDRSGKPVTDLQKGDFIVEDEGKPQEIRFFSLQSQVAPAKLVASTPPGIFSNRASVPTASVGGITVILLDGLNTRWGDQSFARKNVIQYLLQIQPHDRVALYTLGKQLRILHDFTEEPAELVKALTAYLNQNTPDLAASSPANSSAQVPQDAPAAAIQGIIDVLGEEAAYFMRMRVTMTLSSLEGLASRLASVPGRKNLVWVSGGFPLAFGFSADDPYESVGGDPRWNARYGANNPQAVQIKGRFSFDEERKHAVQALNAANVAIYPVDARGLTTNPRAIVNISTMKDLASQTGGKAYYNRNDLMNSIKEAVQDSVTSYTLAYYPSEQKFDGHFRTIKVKVNRPGVSARYRQGYYDTNEALSDDKAKNAAIQEALWSPLDATAVGIEAQWAPQEPSEPGALLLRVRVDPHSITLDQREGRWVGEFNVELIQTDGKGGEYEAVSKTVPLELQQQTYETILQQGVVFTKTVQRNKAAIDLRVVIRDTPSGNMGRVIIPFSKLGGT